MKSVDDDEPATIARWTMPSLRRRPATFPHPNTVARGRGWSPQPGKRATPVYGDGALALGTAQISPTDLGLPARAHTTGGAAAIASTRAATAPAPPPLPARRDGARSMPSAAAGSRRVAIMTSSSTAPMPALAGARPAPELMTTWPGTPVLSDAVPIIEEPDPEVAEVDVAPDAGGGTGRWLLLVYVIATAIVLASAYVLLGLPLP